MAAFKDTTGRTWPVKVTYLTVTQVRDQLGLDLLKVFEQGNDVIARLSVDEQLLFDVLMIATAKRRAEAGVSDEQFMDLLDAETVEQAVAAFLEAYTDFFPGARRAPLRAALRAASKATGQAAAQAVEYMDTLPPPSISLPPHSTPPSGGSPASSASSLGG